ncbi:MAG: PhzF family phenazine biosynthesis protein [Phycisphaerales bacterium]|nr:PhzF family phenazine biosynthesis protein [Phycisphaerales bacterium]
MPETLPFLLVDAFAEQPYRGNPAGVVFDADGLTPEQMQHIAREIRASETAFLGRPPGPDQSIPLRWFTPSCEVDFCGHATLAAAHGVYEAGVRPGTKRSSGNEVTFSTRAGALSLHSELLPPPYDLPVWWLDMPTPSLVPDHTNPIRTCELLGLAVDDLDDGMPPMRTRDQDLILFVRDWQTLIEMTPRFHELAAWSERNGLRGYCVATTATVSSFIQVHSRFFAPAVGIDEDPVTGSVSGPLAVYLVVNHRVPLVDGKAGLTCAQGRPGDRSGLVRALVRQTSAGYGVQIAGQCFTTLSGEVRVPPSA